MQDHSFLVYNDPFRQWQYVSSYRSPLAASVNDSFCLNMISLSGKQSELPEMNLVPLLFTWLQQLKIAKRCCPTHLPSIVLTLLLITYAK